MTHIRVDGNMVDLTYIPTPKFVMAYNAHKTMADLTGRPMLRCFVTTKDHLVQQGLVVEMADGNIRQII